MTKEKEILHKIFEHNVQINELKTELNEVLKRKTWRCYGCDKRTQISKLTIIQDHWYTSPHGCMGGDYWNTSEEVFVPCPKCDTINRICNDFVQIRSVSPIKTIREEKTYKLLSELKRFARERLDWYPRGCDSQMITHDDIDRLREGK